VLDFLLLIIQCGVISDDNLALRDIPITKKFMSLPADKLSLQKSSCALHRIIRAVNVTTAVSVGMSLPVTKTLNF
jgi:hypothetical protein